MGMQISERRESADYTVIQELQLCLIPPAITYLFQLNANNMLDK
jgi:hypothetical protein